MKKTTLLLLFAAITFSAWCQKYKNDDLFKYGFKAGLNLPLVSDYSTVPGKSTLSGEFGFFGRVGTLYCGEFGVEIDFNKRYFTNDTSHLSSMIETKFLQFPLRFLLDIPLDKYQKMQIATGMIYQQLINVSINNVGYSQKNIEKQQFIYTIGIGYSYKFVTLEVNYRHFLGNFDLDTTKKKQKYLNISTYVTF